MKTKIIFLLMLAIAIHTSGQQQMAAEAPKMSKGLVKVTILYPNGEGKTFDMDYYANHHMPMVAELMGDAMKFYKIDKGIAGGAPDAPTPYLAIGYLYFDKVSDFQEAFGPHAEQIRGDITNYTNIVPVVQISEELE